MNKKISSALISVFYKDGLEPLVKTLHQQGVTIYSTGGTQQFIEALSIPCIGAEKVTNYPSILGGRVKTLHPKIFGGILGRRENNQDLLEMKEKGEYVEHSDLTFLHRDSHFSCLLLCRLDLSKKGRNSENN